MSSKFRVAFWIGLSLWTSLPWGGAVQAQTSIPLTLTLEGATTNASLQTEPISTFGALQVFSASTLEELSQQPSVLVVTNGPFLQGYRFHRSPIAPDLARRFFYAEFLQGVDAADLQNLPMDTPFSRIPFSLIVSANLQGLYAGEAVPWTIQALDAEAGPWESPIALRPILVDSTGSTVVSSQAFEPSVVLLKRGKFSGTVQLKSSTPTAGLHLLFEWISASADIEGNSSSRPLTVGRWMHAEILGLKTDNLQQELQRRLEESIDPHQNYTFPLKTDDAGVRVAGNYGEHRKNNCSNRRCYIHLGVDLAPKGAASAAQVVAARGGMVTHIGDYEGAYVVINHGDGWFTRYLHLDKKGLQVHVGQVLKRNALLATGLKLDGDFRPHLHFELRRTLTPELALSNYAPGSSVNPDLNPNVFSYPSASAKPAIEVFGLTGQHPADELFQPGLHPAAQDQNALYCFLRIHQPNDANRLGVNSIVWVDGVSNNKTTLEIADEDAIQTYRIDSSTRSESCGFAMYSAEHENSKLAISKNFFPYWFRWDLGESEVLGPRQFEIHAVGYRLVDSRNYPFTFGPQIHSLKQSRYFEDDSGHLIQEYVLKVEHFLGLSDTRDTFIQEDEYDVELVGEAKLMEAADGKRLQTPRLKKHQEILEYHIQHPVIDRTPFQIKVTSHLSPRLMDIAQFTPKPLPRLARLYLSRFFVNGKELAYSISQNLQVGDEIEFEWQLRCDRGGTVPSNEPHGVPLEGRTVRGFVHVNSRWHEPVDFGQSVTEADGTTRLRYTITDGDFHDDLRDSGVDMRFEFEGDDDFDAAHRRVHLGLHR